MLQGFSVPRFLVLKDFFQEDLVSDHAGTKNVPSTCHWLATVTAMADQVKLQSFIVCNRVIIKLHAHSAPFCDACCFMKLISVSAD